MKKERKSLPVICNMVNPSFAHYTIGYTQGVFDMFHIGHLRLIERAAEQCETLIVGVNSDELVEEYKHKRPVINENDRAEIINGLKGVDRVEIVTTLDKCSLWDRYHFDAIFIGEDWKGNERWRKTEEDLAKLGAKVVYLPHTPNVSSTGLREEKGIGEL